MKYLVPVLFVLISCQPATRQSADDTLSGLADQIDSMFRSQLKPDEPGVALLVAYKGEKVLAKGYGLRDIESSAPITTRTNMRMASVSKQFTALTILSLVNRNLIALNDPADKFLPYPIFSGIAIRNLLDHTSGLPDYYEHFDQNWDRSQIVQNQDVLNWLATNPERNFNPGEQWEYSNTAYLMLALIVEKVSGMEFSRYAREYVFEPVGMSRTNYFNLANPIDIPERAYCYQRDSLGQFEQVDGFFMNGIMGDGAVYTSLDDYFQYDQALRNKSLFSEEIHELIFTPSSTRTVNETERYYGMGWNISEAVASHSGGWFGTSTFVRRYLDTPLTFAIFMNSNRLRESKLVGKTDSLLRVHFVE